jgi:hypothetical protein
MPAFVLRPNGQRRNVTNLGWLLRHASDVSRIQFFPVDRDGAYGGHYDLLVVAETEDGAEYHTLFADKTIARRWFKRPSLRHAEQVWSEEAIKIDPGAFDAPEEVPA